MTKIINKTPHAITIRVDGTDTTFPPDPVSARVHQTLTEAPEVSARAGFPCARRKFGEIVGLPGPDDLEPGTLILVSTIVAEAARAAGRSLGDLLIPDSGPDAIRENGQIVAVRRFICP